MERIVEPLIMKGNKAFLPDEIIVNILKRLPVKSLIRFQCVCKHWKNLVKTPSFIADHLHHSTHRNPSLLVQRDRCINFDFHLSVLGCDMQEIDVQNAPLIDSFQSVHIVGSSNGLLCLKVIDDSRSLNSILLWNPATREIRPIYDFKGMCLLGFGFSPIVNDYKVVIIYVLENKGDRVDRVEVFSLSTKSWKEVEFGNLEGLCIRSEAVSVNGAVFWFAFKEDEDSGHDLIVSFDIANEVFTLIPMPAVDYVEMKKLTVYGNNFAMFCEKWNEDDEEFGLCFELWVMEESIGELGERWRWTNKYTSRPCGLLRFDPMAIWRNEIVCKHEMIDRSDGEYESEPEDEDVDDGNKIALYICNPTAKKFEMLVVLRYAYEHIFNYVESLVSIGNLHVKKL